MRPWPSASGRVALAALLTLLVARPALSVDGVVEINQTRALAGGVTPGDAPGFPVTLDEPGSYRLTSSLDLRGLPGGADLVAIQIVADDVSLDLNGFRILGPALCSGSPGAITCSPGLGVGVSGSGLNSWIRDGTVSGFAAGGVLLGDEARVQNLRVADNGGTGLTVGMLATVEHAVAVANGDAGISAGSDSVVIAASASFNQSHGLRLGAGTGFSSSVATGNGAGAVQGGVALASNVCDGDAGCAVTCTDADGDTFGIDCSPVDCDDDNIDIHPGATEVCDGVDNDCDGQTDEGCGSGSVAIATARASVGPVLIQIPDVLVTYVRPAVGTDPAGFFLQEEAPGPALFVAIDPATLAPSPAVGDRLTLTVTEMALAASLPQATAVSGLSISASGLDVSALTQDVSGVADLVTGLDGHDSELISLSGTLVADFAAAGTGHVRAQLETAAISGDPNLTFRIPSALQGLFGPGSGCTLALTRTPLLRFYTEAQAHAWNASEVAGSSCPDVAVTQAAAATPTEVIVQFDRDVDPGSVLPDGSQFSFDGGLTASGAVASGSQVSVTTSAQTAAQVYTVLVASSIQSLLGDPVSAVSNSAAFNGYVQPAQVRINEVNANVAGGCDLIELRVVAGGTMDGFQLIERTGVVLDFSGLDVLTNDAVVVHFDASDPACNPAGSGNETAGKSEFPAATHANNFDSAYDWYSSDTGITATTNVLTLVDALGNVVDAVLLANDATGTATAADETQAAILAAAGEWEQVGGGVPPGGFVDDDFRANAVLDLDATSTDISGTTIQRADDGDTNTSSDWTMSTASWGATNAGQTDF